MTTEISFTKYQGAGNDFILIDNRKDVPDQLTDDVRKRMCDRRYGIGADGVLELLYSPTTDYKLIYYNADGRVGSLCGNGSRCSIFHFLKTSKGLPTDTVKLECNGVIYEGGYLKDEKYFLIMKDIDCKDIIKYDDCNYFLNTGSPHHVRYADDIRHVDVDAIGKQLCYGQYGPTGCNINFVTGIDANTVKSRTYERFVDSETLACGTGATAVAMIHHQHHVTTKKQQVDSGESDVLSYDIYMPGGVLTVQFTEVDNRITNIKLIGPAEQTFCGVYS